MLRLVHTYDVNISMSTSTSKSTREPDDASRSASTRPGMFYDRAIFSGLVGYVPTESVSGFSFDNTSPSKKTTFSFDCAKYFLRLRKYQCKKVSK